jgi:hypothetical protein
MMADIYDSQEPHRPPLTAEPVGATDSDVSSAAQKSMSEGAFGTAVHGKGLDTDVPEADRSVGYGIDDDEWQDEPSPSAPEVYKHEESFCENGLAPLSKDWKDLSSDGDAAEGVNTEHQVGMIYNLKKDQDDMVGNGEVVDKEGGDRGEEGVENPRHEEKTKDQQKEEYSNSHVRGTSTSKDSYADVVKHDLDQASPTTTDIYTSNNNNASTDTPTTELAQLKLQPGEVGSNSSQGTDLHNSSMETGGLKVGNGIGSNNGETHQHLAHESRRRLVDTFHTPTPQRPAYSRAHTSRTSIRSNPSPTLAGSPPKQKKPERPLPPPHYPQGEQEDTATNETLNGCLRTFPNDTSPERHQDSRNPPIQPHEQDRGNNLTHTDVLNLLHSRDAVIGRLQGTVISLNARLLKLESHKRQAIPSFSSPSSSTYSSSDKMNGTDGRFTAGATMTVEERTVESRLKQKEINTMSRVGNKDEYDHSEEGDLHGFTMWSVYVGLILAAATLGGVLGAAMERGEAGEIFADWMWKQGRGG